MKIFNYFHTIKLTRDQRNALEEIYDFLRTDESVFILKGYAGTGKTTLIKGLVDYLDSQHKSFEVMAPTGRAAKILRDKTNHGKTIHSSIYNLQKIETLNANSKDTADHSVKYYFPLDPSNSEQRLIIVDEASMISSKESIKELFDFGSNILLDDLLTYAFSTNKKNKILFVGDPAQLPPVGDNTSWALKESYFEKLGLSYDSIELTQVLRQKENAILQNATLLRTLLDQEIPSELSFDYDDSSFIKLDPGDVIDKYVEMYPNPELGDGVIISFSNAQCYQYNLGIRRRIFSNHECIKVSDLVLINNNNYHTYSTALFNGDIAKVIDVSDTLESQSSPVWTMEAGEKVKKIVTLDFRKITIRLQNHEEDIPCFIIDSFLNSIDRDLTTEMMKALYINFVMRFQEAQDRRKSSGLNPHKVGSEEFKTALKNDPYYNALKVKYAYAITCHKAQGGEWDKVIVDFQGRVSLKNDPLRWNYTAITRGVNTVFATNAPYFTKYSQLKFSGIVPVKKIPKNALYLENVALSPFHDLSQHKAKSLKYWQIKEQLETTDFEVVNITSKGDFLERYTVQNSLGENIELQASHNGAGFFIDRFIVIISEALDENCNMEDLFNSKQSYHIKLAYSPEKEVLKSLYSAVREACEALKIQITNIEESVPKYYVTYFFVTNSISSSIQFYFNTQGQFTTAIPKSFDCKNDIKLRKLIQNLSDHASK